LFFTQGLWAGFLVARMTDETSIPLDSPTDPAGEAPRPKRSSNPRPKKQPKSQKVENPTTDQPVPVEPSAPTESKVVVESVEDAPSSSGDWPEPEPPSMGGTSSAAEGGKRKRRRKKGKGGKPQDPAPQPDADAAQDGGDDSPARPAAPQGQPPRPQHPQQPPRPKLDSDAVAKLACKIYLAEVSEEGVALIGDSDAKELARRCFRLSEIFLEEQARRR
jgi:hypothetical protein